MLDVYKIGWNLEGKVRALPKPFSWPSMLVSQLPLLPIMSLLRTHAMHHGICSHTCLVCCGFEWEVECEDKHG